MLKCVVSKDCFTFNVGCLFQSPLGNYVFPLKSKQRESVKSSLRTLITVLEKIAFSITALHHV